MATLAIINGQIWDGERPPFRGSVLCNTLITKVLTDPSPALPPNIEVLDARGGTVIPAFTDSHVHFSGVVRQSKCVDLSSAKSASDVIRLLLERSEHLRPTDWVMATKLNHNLWADQTLPTLSQLDTVPNPVVIQHFTAHTHLVNSAAIALVGASAFDNVSDVIRDADGGMTGLLEEDAQAPLRAYLERRGDDPADWIPFIARVLSEGIAEIHAISPGTVLSSESFGLYQRLRAAGQLGVRVRIFINQYPQPPLDVESGFGDDWIAYGGYKIFLDGALGARTAAMRERYADADRDGILLLADDELDATIRRCYRAGLQLMGHTIGDRALDQFLGALERVQAEGITSPWMTKISHLEVCRPEQIARMAKLNVCGDVQGGFVTFLSPFMKMVLGERTQFFVPVKSLIDAGVLVVGSSDAPVEATDPLYGIQGAVVRTKVMNEAERITLDQALRMYTVNAQKLIRNETRKGYLKTGYIADITVFEDDLFAVEPETLFGRKVAATIVDGKIAFRRGS